MLSVGAAALAAVALVPISASAGHGHGVVGMAVTAIGMAAGTGTAVGAAGAGAGDSCLYRFRLWPLLGAGLWLGALPLALLVEVPKCGARRSRPAFVRAAALPPRQAGSRCSFFSISTKSPRLMRSQRMASPGMAAAAHSAKKITQPTLAAT
jgi:hypothetical protein